MTEIHNPHLFILMLFDDRYLFVPQDEVYSVEIIADVQIADNDIGAIGWYFGHELESPVFSLDRNLSILAELPEKHEYFVLLRTAQEPLGITCQQAENINTEKQSLYSQPLPDAMGIPQSPITDLFIYQDKIACVCNSMALTKKLWQPANPDSADTESTAD